MDGPAWDLRKRIRGAFSLAFIGWILVFFDIRISQVDLLPDVVGYLLVVIACARLEDLHRAFAPVRWLALMMLLMTLVMLVASRDMQAFWGLIAMVVEVVTIAWFCTAIATAATEHQAEELAAIARSRRNWMLAAAFGSFALLVVFPRGEMAFFLGIMAIVLLCLFLGLVRRAGRFEW